MNNCSHCGKELNDNAAFCTDCGVSVNQPQQAVYAPMAYNVAPPYAPTAYNTPTTHHTFLNSYLGIILFAMLFFIFLLTGLIASPHFLVFQNLSNVLRSAVIMLPLALSAALTTRAKGVDLSVGSVMALSSIIIAKTIESSGSWVTGLLIALAVCAAIGAANGALTVYLKLPALAVTAVMYFIVYGICRLMASMPIRATNDSLNALSNSTLGTLVFCVLCVAAAFILIMLTPLGKPMIGREKKKEPSYMLAYIVGAVFASFAGLLFVSRVQMALPSLGYNYAIFAAFVAGCIASSRLLDNRYTPAVIALAATLIWSIMINVLTLLSIDSYTQLIFIVLITAVFVALAITNWATARKTFPKA